jgi:hypothetical protein
MPRRTFWADIFRSSLSMMKYSVQPPPLPRTSTMSPFRSRKARQYLSNWPVLLELIAVMCM